MSTSYTIEWTGNVDGTLRGRTYSDGVDALPVPPAPRGPYSSRAAADEAIAAYIAQCEDLGGTVRAAHNPRVTEV